MNTGQTVALTLGSVAVLAALAGGGYYLFRRSQDAKAEPSPVKPVAPAPALPSPDSQGSTPPINPNATPADVLAEIQRQQAEEAERQRQAEIRGFIDRIAAVENLQMLQLAEIDKVNNNRAPLEDFRQQYINQQRNSGRFGALIGKCEEEVWNRCGRFWWDAPCRDAVMPGCRMEQPIRNGYYKGTSGNPEDDRNPWHIIIDEAIPWAEQQLKEWQATQRKPYEARLVELEIQYRGMVKELKTRYGVDYTPQAANAYAGHERASQLLASGNYSAVQPYTVA
ncbi:MAG: hypothetical protein KatS3mg071_2748 [Meiothermus sp.]|nr:MAG: hypothetical protein KatS3mg071_2748 [Meiothermus sp.]